MSAPGGAVCDPLCASLIRSVRHGSAPSSERFQHASFRISRVQENGYRVSEHVLPVCGIKARHVDERPPELPTGGQLAAFIGFSGDLMRGTLTLVAPFSLMRATYPLKLSEDDNWELEIFDWSASRQLRVGAF